MKRVNKLFPEILDWDNLRFAVWRAAKGKRHRKKAIDFLSNCDEHLRQIQDELTNGSFHFGDFTQFPIRDPKPRMITALSFRERIVHHAVIRVCDPCFERFLVDTTYACRKGKGRLAAIARAHRFARQFPWYLKMDVRAFFDSVNHETLLRLLARRFKDSDLLRLFERVIRSFDVSPGRGIPIGSLTSQHFANFYLGWLDHFIKHQLRHFGHVRYMDDFVVWGSGPQKLATSLLRIAAFLSEELQLDLKPPIVQRTAAGMNFLGCQIFPSHVCLNRRNRKRVSRMIEQLQGRLSVASHSECEDQLQLTSLWNFSRSGTTVRLRFAE